MSVPPSELNSDLLDRFSNVLSADTRPGFSGWLIDKSHLLEFASVLRDELGYDYLSSITGVDYLPEEKMEVVYQVYKITGGPGVMFKV
jgi:NADH-quinone oxidoreductase subunit C/D